MAQTSIYIANTDRFIQNVGVFMDKTEIRIQILRATPIGALPSDTEVAKRATHEQCKAIKTRSGKQLKEVQVEKE